MDGERLRYLRITQGMSQRDLAEKIGMTTAAISDIERGKRQPYPRTLVKLARALGVESAQLLKDQYAFGE